MEYYNIIDAMKLEIRKTVIVTDSFDEIYKKYNEIFQTFDIPVIVEGKTNPFYDILFLYLLQEVQMKMTNKKTCFEIENNLLPF